jgi:hypothetical protein
MQNKEQKAGTTDEQCTDADFSTSASVEASPMLSAALSAEEGNKLIAEFDGWKFMRMVSEFPLWQKFNKKGKVIHEGVFRLPEYHNNWNMLIPACKKFDGLNILDTTYEDLCDEIDRAVSCYEILPTFKNLVTAIKWYNDNAVPVGSR